MVPVVEITTLRVGDDRYGSGTARPSSARCPASRNDPNDLGKEQAGLEMQPHSPAVELGDTNVGGCT